MKRKILCFLLTAALVFTLGLPGSGFNVYADSQEWTQVGPDPYLNEITCLQGFNNQLYKGTGGVGVFVWNNSAWVQAGTGLPDGKEVRCLADISGTLYAGVEQEGVWTLENGVWNQVGVSSWPTFVYDSIYPDSAVSLVSAGGTVYATTYYNGGVWKYESGTWTQAGASSWPMVSEGTLSSPDRADNLIDAGGAIYVATNQSGVWKYESGAWTQAGALSWPMASNPWGVSPDEAVSLVNVGGTIYAGTEENDVLKLESGAWSNVDGVVPSWPSGEGAHFLADVSGTLYAVTTEGNMLSWNGASWIQVDSFRFSISSLASVNGTLYCGSGNYVYVLNGGDWQQVGIYDGLPYDSQGEYCLPLADVGGTLYAGTVNGVYKFTNSKWIQISESWPLINGTADRACSLLVDGSGKVYAGTARNGVYTLENDVEWYPVGNLWPSGEGASCLASLNGMIYAGTYHLNNNGNKAGSGVYVMGSNNIWSSTGNIGDAWLTSLASVAGKLYVSAWANGVCSLENGDWTDLDSGDYPSSVYSLSDVNGTLYAGGYDSNNTQVLWAWNGADWAEKASSLTDGTNEIHSLKEIDGTLYAGTNQGVFTVSSDGGLTKVGSSVNGIYSLTRIGGKLYAGTNNGVLVYGSGDTGNENDDVHHGRGGGSTPSEATEITTAVSGNTATFNIPKAALEKAADGTDALKLSTPVASLSFDTAALSTIFGKASGDVKITAAKVDSTSLTAETQQLVGDRPVFNFSVTSGNDTISEFRGNVTVSVPYTPKAGEDTDAIVIYYINAEGKPEAVTNCKYDPATKTMTFITDHFSQYAVGYNKVEFSDIKAGAWYENAVDFTAARGIVTGTGNGNFSPDGKLTRGQLLVMLMRAYGIEPDTDLSNNFFDAGNTYYTGYLAAAKRLGITEGLGNNLYAPDKQITRQEMFTLLYNTLKVIGELPESDGKASGALTGYSDADSVTSWAKDAAGTLADEGIIGGSNGKLSPKNTTTRSEMAQVLYNLLSK